MRACHILLAAALATPIAFAAMTLTATPAKAERKACEDDPDCFTFNFLCPDQYFLGKVEVVDPQLCRMKIVVNPNPEGQKALRSAKASCEKAGGKTASSGKNMVCQIPAKTATKQKAK